MEIFNPTHLNGEMYRSTINQSGKGTEMDRYIYSQTGEGIGAFFGNLARTIIPFIGQSIKGAAKIAKSYLREAAKDIVNTGAKRASEKLSTSTIHKRHTKTKTKKPKRWQNL